jgi:indolepyruvate ferredoxin oxidoreductase
MNAPLNSAQLQAASLDDKYDLEQGYAFMSGIQALVRLPMVQQQRDALAGKNTGGFISGYRGSPLGAYDQMLHREAKRLQAHQITFQPGVNEELAATALWGTQQLGFAPAAARKHDGVFGIWYGKGPGVDRCADVFKHANLAGTTPWGGVLAVAGDDHVAKSSTAAHQSDHIFKACGLPVFFPSNVQEILDMGLHAIALSRFAGVWSGMKTIQEVVESSARVAVDVNRLNIITPEFAMPPGGVHIRWPDAALEQEARLLDHKWYAALAYIRANGLNYTAIEGPSDRFGIMASGKAYNDVRQALADLGLDEATCHRVGLRLHKVGVVWPLEAQGTRAFATGLREILVVEEKRQVIEYQLKEELYNWRSDVRPNVLGKFDEREGDNSGGEWSSPNPSAETLLRANADLNPALIARAIAKRLLRLGVTEDVAARMHAHLAILDAQAARTRDNTLATPAGDRQPWFCSGCPHNTSTKVPEGSRAMAGIGCHFMSVWMDRATVGFTQMGGEGVPWVGQAPFTRENHVFANLGDGTYFHSGILAVRQSIAAGVNITYKILYNDAVAMTGGQRVGERPEGHSVVQIAHSMVAEGAALVTVVTDEPSKYDGVTLPNGVAVQHRDTLESLQLAMRQMTGTTVIIYDQTCATEKRRRRKRGTMAVAEQRVVINEAVCEGCGDCGVQSNCLSVEPLETPLGRKRTINQNSCNSDYSCLKGFCPSFVTVKGATLKKRAVAQAASPAAQAPALPEPRFVAGAEPWAMLVAGVGGTGVITVGQILGQAAHMEGKGVVTQDAAGLAQKGGSTWSHIMIADSQEAIHTTRVDIAGADLVLGCDPIVAANAESMSRMREGRTHVALNAHGTPTAAFVKNTEWQNPAADCQARLEAQVGVHGVAAFDADGVATKLVGDSIYTNPVVMGFAWQKGWIPLQLASIQRAFELNGVQVANNLAAFDWGRRCAHDWPAVQAVLAPAQVITFKKAPTLDDAIALRTRLLTDYQNAAYAAEYTDFIEQVRAAERNVRGEASLPLTLAVAHQLYRLMAIKDEYEVARLHADPAFAQSLRERFDGDLEVHYHLAPPLLSKRNAKGELLKSTYGPWLGRVFKVLAKFKGLRGTAFDVFGHTEERREERALMHEYKAAVGELLATLSADNHALALEVAKLPEMVRGFGHVKMRNLVAVRSRWDTLMAQWRQGPAQREAA